MKKESIGYVVCALLILAGAIMKIMHWPHAASVTNLGFIAALVFQSSQIALLKSRIRELESKSGA